jgi:hypothetical protein
MLPSQTGWKFGGAGGEHYVVSVHVQHLAICGPDDHHRARIDAHDIVSKLARQHGDLPAFCARLSGCGFARFTGTDHHQVGMLTAHGRGRVIG